MRPKILDIPYRTPYFTLYGWILISVVSFVLGVITGWVIGNEC